MHLMTPLKELTPEDRVADRRQLRDAARYTALRGGPSSPQGMAMTEALLAELIVALNKPLRPTSLQERREAMSALLADLLFAASDNAWTQRSEKPATFTGQPVGRTAFYAVRDSLLAQGYLERLKGYSAPAVKDSFLPPMAEAPCLRATPALIARAEAFGIALEDAHHHFRLVSVATRKAQSAKATGDIGLIEARATKTLAGKGGGMILSDPEGLIDTMTERMAGLNSFLLDGGRIAETFAFGGLRRVFHNADNPGFNWQWGGRMYSLSGWDSYESWKGRSAARGRRIQIDGQSVVEVDISACHLTILYGLHGMHFDSATDPYAVTGFDREDVKKWVTGALGAGKATFGGNSMAKVRKATLGRHPILRSLDGDKTLWASLQYHESEILLRALEALRAFNVVALPIHDGVILPASHSALGRKVLKQAFTGYFKEELGMTTMIIPRVA